jgi:parallel beta-helix repeat protein
MMLSVRGLLPAAVLFVASLSQTHAQSAPVSVAVNSVKVSPATAKPGMSVTFTAVLTANQSVSGYPLEISLIAPRATAGTKAVLYMNYQANKGVTGSATWTVPASASTGTYRLVVNAYDPVWSVPDLASASTSFAIAPKTSTEALKPGPNSALYAKPFYTCSRRFYVATNGKDSNAGTEASPWLTIQHADSSSRKGGDCIIVEPGTYQAGVLIQHGGSSPSPTGYVAYRCAELDKCHVLAASGGHLWGFANAGNFVVVDGFEVDGNNALMTNGIADACFGSDAATYGTGKSSHHIWVINNIIHHCNLAGVSFNNKEWYYVLYNRVYHNSWTSGYQGSGIAFVVPQCIEADNSACATGETYTGGTGSYVPSGMDLTYRPPFHNLVAGNVVYDNMIASTNPVSCGSHTDGNGIIMDTFFDMATNTIAFPFQTLVEGNISYQNGGRGIHVFRSSNIIVANNTVFGNGTDTCINAYYLGDLSQQGGSHDVWINNISQSVLTAANPKCGTYCGNRNVPLLAGNGGDDVDTSDTYANNITFGGDGVKLFNNDTSYFSCSQNKCNTNPLLAGVASLNFALEPTSPAVGYLRGEGYLPEGTSAAGACQMAFTKCP